MNPWQAKILCRWSHYDMGTMKSDLPGRAFEYAKRTIAKAGAPLLRLVPYRERKIKRKAGVLKGQIWIAPDFDETPQEVIDSFYNSKIFPDEDE